MVHAPSIARAILREMRDGTPPKALIKEVPSIPDAAQRAMTYAKLASHGAPCNRLAVEEACKVERVGSKAEVWETVLKAVDKPYAKEAAVEDICAMPDGAWTRDALIAAAPFVGKQRSELLARAVQLRGDRTAAKAILRAAGDNEANALREILQACSPDDQAMLMPLLPGGAGDALAAAWKLEDPGERREALRVLTWRSEGDALRTIRRSAEGKSPEEAAYILLTTAARADRLNMEQAPRWLAEAKGAIDGLPDGPDAKRLQRKFEQGQQRNAPKAEAGSTQSPPAQRSPSAAPEAPAAPAAAESSVEVPATPRGASASVPETPPSFSGRHVLALVDGYTGGLGKAHLQAIGRAAPLCVAFDLDLALLGFPTEDLPGLIALVEKETNIGEGAGYARELFSGGRIQLLEDAEQLPGTRIATTPHPDRPVDLEGHGQVSLLLGLGRQGLPNRILHGSVGHYEATGAGISLETATAMGLLADRLGRVPSN